MSCSYYLYIFLIFLVSSEICQSLFLKFETKTILKSAWIPIMSIPNMTSSGQCSFRCVNNDDCNAFRFDSETKTCQLGNKKNPKAVMPTSTSDQAIQINVISGNFKLMVVGGYAGWVSNTAEIYDLESPTSVCASFPPIASAWGFEGVRGGLTFGETPIVCGGTKSGEKYPWCYTYKGGTWQNALNMLWPNWFFAISQSPFKNSSQSLFITGGYGQVNKAAVLTPKGWEEVSTPLPVNITDHCMVKMADSSIIIIGGIQNGVVGPKTFIFDPKDQSWFSGPQMNVGRYSPACSLIPTSGSSEKLSVIVAGGSWISSTEILDGNTWRFGPVLPGSVWKSTLLMHPRGGVILVAGSYNGEYAFSNKIFRLRYAGPNSKWELLPKTLLVGKLHATAFLVPAEISDCTTV